MNIIGIDVSKAKLDCAWLKHNDKIRAKAVNNTEAGWKELIERLFPRYHRDFSVYISNPLYHLFNLENIRGLTSQCKEQG